MKNPHRGSPGGPRQDRGGIVGGTGAQRATHRRQTAHDRHTIGHTARMVWPVALAVLGVAVVVCHVVNRCHYRRPWCAGAWAGCRAGCRKVAARARRTLKYSDHDTYAHHCFLFILLCSEFRSLKRFTRASCCVLEFMQAGSFTGAHQGSHHVRQF